MKAIPSIINYGDHEYWAERDRSGREGMTADGAPVPEDGSGGGSGSGGGASGEYISPYTITTNYAEYTNFWLTITNNPTNASYGVVSLVSTLPGLTYEILTNSSLSSTNWGVWQTLLATNSITRAPTIDLSLNALFFIGRYLGRTNSYLTNGLVAYWKLNDESGTTAVDSSGNGADMTLLGDPTWGASSLILNGTNQYGYIGNRGNMGSELYKPLFICQTKLFPKKFTSSPYWVTVTFGARRSRIRCGMEAGGFWEGLILSAESGQRQDTLSAACDLDGKVNICGV